MTDPVKTQTIGLETAVDASSQAAAQGGHPPVRRPWMKPTVEDAGVWSATADKHTAPLEQTGAESAKDGS